MRNPFTIVGAVIAVVGLILLAVGVFAGGARSEIWPIGIFFVPFGAIFFFVGRRVGNIRGLRPRLLKTGLPTRALVKRIWETGMTVNNDPVLGFEVEVVDPKGVAPYLASVQQIIPRILVGGVLPGSVLGIETDPEDPEQIAIDWSIAPESPGFEKGGEAAEEVLDDALSDLATRRVSAADLLARGRRATAVIASMRRMGRIGDLGLADPGDERADDELFLMELEVDTPWGEAVSSRVLHRVPDHLVGRVGPGLKVVVAVDRANPGSEVAIDWEALS